MRKAWNSLYDLATPAGLSRRIMGRSLGRRGRRPYRVKYGRPRRGSAFNPASMGVAGPCQDHLTRLQLGWWNAVEPWAAIKAQSHRAPQGSGGTFYRRAA